MINYEERAKLAAPIVRGLREKAGIIDDPPLTDFEVCSLEKIWEAWETMMTKEYIKEQEDIREHLVDVEDIVSPEEVATR